VIKGIKGQSYSVCRCISEDNRLRLLRLAIIVWTACTGTAVSIRSSVISCQNATKRAYSMTTLNLFFFPEINVPTPLYWREGRCSLRRHFEKPYVSVPPHAPLPWRLTFPPPGCRKFKDPFMQSLFFRHRYFIITTSNIHFKAWAAYG